MDFLGAIMGWGQVQNNMVLFGKGSHAIATLFATKVLHTTISVAGGVGTIHVHLLNRLRFFGRGNQVKTKSEDFFLKQMEGYTLLRILY